MDKDTTKLAIREYLFPLNHPILQKNIQEQGLDRYVKKLNCLTTTKLFVFAQLKQIRSYSNLSLQLSSNKKLQKVMNLSSISKSQLSRKWRDLDSSFLEQVFKHMVQQVISRFGKAKAGKMLEKLHLVDASTIMLCLSKYQWAPFSKHKGAVKLHLRFVHTQEVSYPDEVHLTDGKVADRKRMNELVSRELGCLNVFDRGYVDYKLFDEFCKDSVLFVTRLKHNAECKILEERLLTSTSNIERDATILLGGSNKKSAMERPVRLIECLDLKGERVRICTNDFERSAEEIGEIYRRRWQIELFFKWIKQHFHVKRFYGTSKNAVYNQLYTALIAFCLGLLLQNKVQHKGTLLEIVERMRLCWDGTIKQFIEILFKPPSRTSRGRRKAIDVQDTFAQILSQVEAGQAEYWDEATMDI
ncbi:Transposase DDE domain protein [compost metagenome]